MENINKDLMPLTQVKDIELTAVLPQEMVGAQKQLISWCDAKVASIRNESEELRLATEHAKAAKWKHSTLQSQYNKSLKRIEYYEKIKAALEHGFYIVPNFPIQMFAIRKGGHKDPKGFERDSASWGRRNFEQNAQELPEGDGVYRNPFPIVVREEKRKTDGTLVVESYPRAWDDFEFPINMAKPQIMSVTQTALALKIFDRVGVMPSVKKKKEDPVIIGQIINKIGPYSERIVSFMIAWHLNTNVL